MCGACPGIFCFYSSYFLRSVHANARVLGLLLFCWWVLVPFLCLLTHLLLGIWMATGLGQLRKQAVNSHVSLFLSTLGNAFICNFLIFFSTSMSRQPLIFCSQGLPLMDICACACIHACLWRPKFYVEFLFQLHSPVFLRQGLSLNLELANWARLAGQQPWGSSCRHPLVLGLQASAAPDVLLGCWCSKLRSFCLCSKHVADWAVFSPRTFIYGVTFVFGCFHPAYMFIHVEVPTSRSTHQYFSSPRRWYSYIETHRILVIYALI